VNKNSIPNIWAAQEKVAHTYKLVSFGLAGFVLFLIMGITAMALQNPIVLVRTHGEQEFYPTERRRAPLEKADVEEFTKSFLASLYVWKEFNGERIARAVAPFADSALVVKVVDAQSQKYVKELKGKSIAQAITFVEVDVQEAKVVCRFDRVLKIEGIPLVIPAEVTLAMEQGEPTRLNPMGIYVTGILENDNAK
jgi:hypothetical protein